MHIIPKKIRYPPLPLPPIKGAGFTIQKSKTTKIEDAIKERAENALTMTNASLQRGIRNPIMMLSLLLQILLFSWNSIVMKLNPVRWKQLSQFWRVLECSCWKQTSEAMQRKIDQNPLAHSHPCLPTIVAPDALHWCGKKLDISVPGWKWQVSVTILSVGCLPCIWLDYKQSKQ